MDNLRYDYYYYDYWLLLILAGSKKADMADLVK